MGKYPYTLKISSLEKLLKEIPSMGVPSKINTATLPTIGYKAKNDRSLSAILKFIDFLDTKGVPTKNYRDFRNNLVSRSVMAKAIRTSYADLFSLYPDANEKDDTALRDFFSGTTDAGDMVKRMTAEVFKVLCKFADFKKTSVTPPLVETEKKVIDMVKTTTQMPTGITINLNIQLTLPATEDATIYDKIFKALKENVLSRD